MIVLLNATRPTNNSSSNDFVYESSERPSASSYISTSDSSISISLRLVPDSSINSEPLQVLLSTTSGSSPLPQAGAVSRNTTTIAISAPLPLTMESWALPYPVTKILSYRNTSCPPFEPSNYPSTVKSIKTLPPEFCPSDPYGGGGIWAQWEDACLGAYCAYAIDSALRSYYTLNTSKAIWTSTRLTPAAVYDTNNNVVGRSTITRVYTCMCTPSGSTIDLSGLTGSSSRTWS